MRRRSACVALAAVLGVVSMAASAAPRVFVASYGSDANAATQCGYAAPCRSFAAAIAAVDPGGEIVALDAAGYGAVTIDRSVSIIANPGVFAGIAASSGAAISIATPGVDVTLRGLSINGVGAARGINMTAGAGLTVENCVLSNFTNYGIFVYAAAQVRVTDTVVRGNGFDGVALGLGARASFSNLRASRNGQAGVLVNDGAVVTTRATISDSDLSNNLSGVIVISNVAGGAVRADIGRSTLSGNSSRGLYVYESEGPAATASIAASAVVGNAVGLENGGAGIFSQGNNLVNGNDTNTVGVITNSGGA